MTAADLRATYLLKSELIALCKTHGLPTNGSKADLLNYLCDYLNNKPVTKISLPRRKINSNFEPSLDKIIDINYTNNEQHRAFFKEVIGKSFTFNVKFMQWMDANKGHKTYREAVAVWQQIKEEQRAGIKPEIGKQFEYNQYTHDFFAANPTMSRADCIRCWNFKKSQRGAHKYEIADLQVLEKDDLEIRRGEN